MTDNEIIKALECCTNADCLNCPRWSEEWSSGMCNDFLQSVLDLINRQKAEIERLHCILLAFTDQVHTWSNKKGYDTTELSLIPILNEAKDIKKQIEAEAIEEFAERLKGEMLSKYCVYFDYEITNAIIDNLVEEMTEEKK